MTSALENPAANPYILPMTDYHGEYLFPPRPERAIPAAMLSMYAGKGWLAQVKKNGTSNIVVVRPDRTLETWNRHKESHKLWTPTAASSQAFKSIPGNGYFVFVAELMHSKVKGGERDVNYLHDCLVADGRYLLGATYAQRYAELVKAFRHLDWAPQGESPADAVKLNAHTFILKAFLHGDGPSFKDRYAALSKPEDEGLVLKDPNAKLRLCDRAGANADGMVKCRRAHKNYSF